MPLNKPMSQRKNPKRNKYLETNGNATYQNLWYTQKIIVISTYIKKQDLKQPTFIPQITRKR